MKKYMTVKEWVEQVGYLPLGGVRHLIHSNKDFKKSVVKHVGKKILLDVAAIEEWISNQC